MEYIGELAALSTACLWALTSIFFTEAGKLVGSFFVNQIRLFFAVAIYLIISLLTTGQFFPANINLEQFLWLAVSGVVGLVIGDTCGFKAFVMIGPRLATLVFSSTPIMTTIIAWVFLGEKLAFWDILGICITVGGITWVVSERKFRNVAKNNVHSGHPDAGGMAKGVMFALLAGLGQASGLVLARQAMFNSGETVTAFDASFVRMTVAVVVIWLISMMRGQLPDAWRAMKNGRALLMSLGGAIGGPFLGVWMSLVALAYIATGIAATLNSLTPVLVIPIVVLYYKEKVSVRAMLGAIVAVAGVAMLFLT